MIDLEEVAVALDAFPHWDETMRAEVFHGAEFDRWLAAHDDEVRAGVLRVDRGCDHRRTAVASG